MIPISSIWIGDRLSLMERACIGSYLRFKHPFRLYCYSTPDGIPTGVEIVDASTILPESRVFRSSNGAVGDFANLFKYVALRDHGGCWTEMDEFCLRPWVGLGTFISSEATPNGGTVIDQAAIRIEWGHPMMAALVDECEARLRDDTPVEWGTFGVQQFARAVERHGLTGRVVPPETFCSLPWWRASELLMPGTVPDAYGIQLWNEAWRRSEWDKDNPPPGSLYDSLVGSVNVQSIDTEST